MPPKKLYERHHRVADYVRKRIAAGATIKSIAQSAASKYESVPSNPRTFAKLYQDDINEAKAMLEDKVGEMVLQRAEESDKILELLARSRANFNPTEKLAVAEIDSEELDDASAVNDILRMLGKDTDEDEDN